MAGAPGADEGIDDLYNEVRIHWEKSKAAPAKLKQKNTFSKKPKWTDPW